MKLNKSKNISVYLISLIIIVVIQIISLFFIKPIEFNSKEYLAISQSIYERQEYSRKNPDWKGFENFKGESPTRMRQPVYPFFLVTTYWLMGGSIINVIVIQIIINIFSFFIIIKVAEKIFGSESSGLTIFILAFYFPFWILSSLILTETLFSCFLILSIYFLTKGLIEEKNKLFILSGLLLGIALLTRPISLFVIIFLIIPLFLYYRSHRAVRMWFLMIIPFIIIIALWFIRNVISLGDYTPISSDGGYNLWCASFGIDTKPWTDDNRFREIVKDGYYIDGNANKVFFEKGLKNILNNPFEFIKNGVIRIFYIWTYFPGSRSVINYKYIFYFTKIIQFLIIITAFIGIFIRDKFKLKHLLYAPSIGFTFLILFSHGTSRYLIPVMPFIILLSGLGISKMIFKIKQSRIF